MITVLHKLCTTKVLGLYRNCKIKFHSSVCSKSIRELDYYKRYNERTSFGTDTNVQNDVFLYKFENWNFHRKLMIFEAIVLIGCGITFFHSLDTILEAIRQENSTAKEIIKKYTLACLLGVSSVIFGLYSCALIWFVIRRSLKYIILRKGGESVTLVTFHPLKKECQFTVPLEMVQPKLSRESVQSYMALKVKDHWLYYLMDEKGVFNNPTLYDHTVGLRKGFKIKLF